LKYEIGDTVLVLHTGEEGRVVDIVSEQMVMIEVDGVRFPVYNDQIDFPYFRMFTAQKVVEKKKTYVDQLPAEKQPEKTVGPPGVYLSFVPVYDKDIFEDEVVDRFRIYLLNQTSESYAFTYTCQAGKLAGYPIENAASPHSDFYLHDIPFAEAADNPQFMLNFRLNPPDKRKVPHYESVLRLRPKALFRKMEEMKATGGALFRFLLFDAYPDLPLAEKMEPPLPVAGNVPVYRVEEATRFIDRPVAVIDLHIEKLTDSWSHFTGSEMLHLQLQTFERCYDRALAHYQPNLTVIHGVGSGRLKEEIHRLLRDRRAVKDFSDAYSPLYGYGATVINFVY
jgi:hypothetical protein